MAQAVTPPDTLPKDFNGWDAQQSAGPPDTLPANFDKWDADATDQAKPGLVDRVKARFQSMTEPTAQPTTEPSMQNLGADIGNIGKRAARFVGDQVGAIPGAVKTAYGVVTGDPEAQDRAEKWADQTGEFGVTALGSQVKQYADTAKTDPVRAFTDMAGDALGMAAIGKATDAVAETPGALKERARGMVQKVAGAGPEAVKVEVGKQANKAAEDEQAVHADNQKATEQTLEGRGKVDEANQKQSSADRAAQEKVRTKNAEATARTLEKRGKTDEANVAQLRKDTESRKQALLENRRAAQEHKSNVADVNHENESELARHAERDRVQAELDKSSAQLDAKYEAAKAKAKGQDDALWTKVREKTGQETTATPPLVAAAEIATDRADPNSSALFRRILKPKESGLPTLDVQGGAQLYVDAEGRPFDRGSVSPARFDDMVAKGTVKMKSQTTRVLPSDPQYARFYEEQYGEPPPIDTGAPVSFDQLHRWYNWIQDKMYGGGDVPAGTYQAYKIMRDALNHGMQDIAERTGAGEDLAAARASHTKRMETFSDSPNQKQTVASKSLQETTPELQKQKARQERVGKVAEYDPTVTSHVAHIENLRSALDRLPKSKPVRDIVKPLPVPPEAKTVPEVRPPQPYPEPESHEAIPPVSAPKQYGEPAPTKAFEKPEVDTQAIRRERVQKLQSRLQLTGYDVGILMSSALAAPLEALMGRAGEALRIGAMGYVGGKGLARALVSNPRFVEWVSKPPANELEILNKIPHVEKVKFAKTMTDAIAEAQRQGKPIRVAGPVAAFIANASQPPRNRKEALDRKP